jgi:hypothetical protein
LGGLLGGFALGALFVELPSHGAARGFAAFVVGRSLGGLEAGGFLAGLGLALGLGFGGGLARLLGAFGRSLAFGFSTCCGLAGRLLSQGFLPRGL